MPASCGCGDDLPSDITEKKRFLQYAKDTNMHGPESILRSQNIVRRIGWTVMFMTGWGMTLWLSVILIQEYYTYPTNTVITLIQNTSMKFPAVTICNINPIRLSALNDLGLDMQNVLNLRGTTSETTDPQTREVDDNDSQFFSKKNADRLQYLDFQLLYANMSNDVKESVGHNLSDMLLSCVYDEYECSTVNFTYFHNYKYGNCYVFNSGSHIPTLRTFKSGPVYGLSLELYIEHGQYIENLAEDAGIRAEIHSQSEMPFPEDVGLSLSPGHRTYVGISMVEVKRAESPYGDCKQYTSNENIALNAFRDATKMYITYSDFACTRTCLQKLLIKKCGCCSYEYPCSSKALNSVWRKHNIKDKFCNSSITKEARCQTQADIIYKKGQSRCLQQCKQRCDQTQFSSEVSMSMWPSNPRLNSIVDKLMQKNNVLKEKLELMTMQEKTDFLRRNVLKVDVYYKQLSYEKMDTQKSYGADNLLSDIGGQLGLWLGLSVVTLFEFVELIADVIILLARKCRSRQETNEVNLRVERSMQLPASKNV